jgi:hypothetical protein
LRQPLEQINAPILYRIQSVYLADTIVDDAIIEPLGSLRNLTEIDVSRTQVTDRGLEQIKEMFPRARITYEASTARSAEIDSSGERFN